MTISSVEIENFSAFAEEDIRFSSNVNVFTGENGTGKSHLVKLLHVACRSRNAAEFRSEFSSVFHPKDDNPGIFTNSDACVIEFSRENSRIFASFSGNSKIHDMRVEYDREYPEKVDCLYFPQAAGLPHTFEDFHRENTTQHSRTKIEILEILKTMIGTNTIEKQGSIRDFSVLSAGFQSLNLLSTAFFVDFLKEGSVFIWDTPEGIIGPKLYEPLARIFTLAGTMGIQVFLITNSYLLINNLNLLDADRGNILFHVFEKNTDGTTSISSGRYREIHPAHLLDPYRNLYDKIIEKTLSTKPTEKGMA